MSIKAYSETIFELSHEEKSALLLKEALMLMTETGSIGLAMKKYEQAAKMGNETAKQTVAAYHGQDVEEKHIRGLDLPSMSL